MNGIYQLISNFPAHPFFHLTLSGLIIVFIFVYLYFKHKEFHTTDQFPELLYLQTHKKLDLIPNIPNIVEVKTGMYIKNFPVFDLIANTFVIDALIWFEFNPSLIRLETIEKFSFERGRIVSKSLPEMKLEKNLLLVKYNVQAQFSTNLDHKFFPMNDHMLHIVLTNENISPLELFFTVRESSFAWSSKIHTHDWHIINKAVRAGYADLLLDCFDKSKTISHPRVVYSLFLARTGMRKAALIFIPVLVVYLLGTYSLILPPKFMPNSILTMGIGSVSGLLAYRFVIEKISPNVGYFTLTEYFYTLVLGISFITFLIGFLRVSEPNNDFLYHLGTIWFVLTQVIVILSLQYYLRKLRTHKKVLHKKGLSSEKILKAKNKIEEERITLSKLQEYAANNIEFPDPDDENWLNLDYSSFYTSYAKQHISFFFTKILYLLKLKKTPVWSPEIFKNCLIDIVTKREPIFLEDYVVKITVKTGFRFVIWGDLQGAFHSLIRDLSELKKLGLIDDDLKLTSNTIFFVFNGDLIDRGPYVLETLTVAMWLMLKNPNQVFYIKGNHENKNVWQDFQTYREVLAKTKHLGENVSHFLLDYLERFFETLPTAVYIKSALEKNKGIMRISHYRAKDLPYDEESLADFLFEKESPTVDDLPFSQNIGTPKKFFLDALIVGLNRSTIYKVTRGLELLPPDKAATTWSLLSSPIITYRELYHFHFDTFAILDIKEYTNQWLMTLYSQDIRKLKGYSKTLFHLLYGIEIHDLQPIQQLNPTKEILLGCTLDLSKTSAILGERIREGLHLGVTQKNLEGGVKHSPIRLITMDDQYTPHLAKKNILSFLEILHTNLIISPVGTSTVEAILPLIQEKKLLVIFPYSGANTLRSKELDHIIHFRPSYAREARALIQYTINSLGLRRLALFYQNDSYGWSAVEGAKKMLEKFESVEIIEAPYQRNDPNVDDAATKILEFNPSAILFFSTQAPSIALIHKLGVNNLTDKALLGISFLTDAFRSFLRTFGLDLTISRVVPQINSNNLPIVDEYRFATRQQKTFIYGLSEDSLEGYINASLFLFILEFIDPPITKEKIIRQMESISNMNYKGLELNFNQQTRELSKAIWLDIGTTEWIIESEFTSL